MNDESKQPFRRKKKPGLSFLQLMEIALGNQLSAGEKQSIVDFESDIVLTAKKEARKKWKGKKWKGKKKGKGKSADK